MQCRYLSFRNRHPLRPRLAIRRMSSSRDSVQPHQMSLAPDDRIAYLTCWLDERNTDSHPF